MTAPFWPVPYRRARSARLRARRGAALVLVLLMTGALAGLALSAVYLASSSTLMTKAFDREQDFKYAADAAVAVGKSRLNHDPYALPDKDYRTIISGERVDAADGRPVPGLTVNVHVGLTGSTTGQFGRFASVVAEARDGRGARFVRRLELTQESFARFAYWTNIENQANGDPILFGGGDQLWGPVWSNDDIEIMATGSGVNATFHDDVGTARTIINKPRGDFRKGPPLERQDVIPLPVSQVGRLPGYAAAGKLSFTAQGGGGASAVRTRLELVALDLNADGDSTDAEEGFVRVYNAVSDPSAGSGVTAVDWLRGDQTVFNCGDFHWVDGAWRFYPAAIHADGNYQARWAGSVPGAHRGAGGTAANMTNNSGDLSEILGAAKGQTGKRYLEDGAPQPRCYPGGHPRLAPVERSGAGFTGSRKVIGGDDTTFTRLGRYGRWESWPDTLSTALTALTTLPATSPRHRSLEEARTLHPLGREANPGTMGVIHVRGTAGVSGTLRGRVTVYSTANLVLLDDLRYASDPSVIDPARQMGLCNDVLGVLADSNVVVADNALNTPQNTAAGMRSLGASSDLFVHGVVMALRTSFTVENFAGAPANAVKCQTNDAGRGCLHLTGGLIQERRGAVGTSGGTGFVKRYSYDRCAAVQPPPYFPTTGRFLDNRYLELDPVGFDPAKLFASLRPNY